MLLCTLDASAWAKRYTREPGCDVVDLLMDELVVTDHALVLISGVTYAETVATTNRFHHRTDMEDEDFQALLQRIRQDLSSISWIPIADHDFRNAVNLILAHNINSSDAAQLAAIQRMLVPLADVRSHQVYMISADKRLLRAAQREGIETLDPEVVTLREARALFAA